MNDGKILPVVQKTNVQVALNPISVAKMQKVFDSYNTEIKESIENVLKNPTVDVQAFEKISNVQYSESQRLRMMKSRNNLLQRRALRRSQEEEAVTKKELPIVKFR